MLLVLPLSLTLSFEPIENDGTSQEYRKNDCELAAAKRLLKNLNSLYPRRSFCMTGDNLFATAPITKQLKENGWSFIITAKPERNKELFSWYDYLHEQKEEWLFKDAVGLQHHYQWSNKLPIKQDQKADDFTFVNLLEYSVTDTNSNVLYYNTWMTDIYLHENNVKEVAAGGRARFKIENVTFNEQKTKGCFIEHKCVFLAGTNSPLILTNVLPLAIGKTLNPEGRQSTPILGTPCNFI
ncbi:MAG: hypothetical protein H6625_11260 [Bdellovibrionaceae bacterium]|nr:hypothetical protein [Pseudobdellovibrionaceae bacterium]